MSETAADQVSDDTKTESTTTTTTETTKQADEEKSTKTAEQWEAEAREARKEAQSLRNRLRDAEGKVKESEDAKLSDIEKAKKDAELATDKATKLEQRVITSELKAAAAKAGFKDPSDAIALLDRSKLEIEDGEVKNADALLKELAKAKPYLLGEGGSPPGGRTPHGGGDQATLKERAETLKKRFNIR